MAFLCHRLWYVEPVVQLRRYAPYLVAEVTVESDTMREALTSGFKQVILSSCHCWPAARTETRLNWLTLQVAGFIFGDNVSARSSSAGKVAMTSPVIAEQQNKSSKSSSEKVAMTSPVTAEMEGGKYAHNSLLISIISKKMCLGFMCSQYVQVCGVICNAKQVHQRNVTKT